MNEDRFTLCPDIGLFMAADGMGGHACGEVAAEIALESVEEHLRGTEVAWPDTLLDPESAAAHLASAVLYANRRVREEAAKDVHRFGMGTTFAGLVARSGWAAVAHVGDSRIYRVREGVFELLTEDHTFSNHVTRTGLEVDPIQLIAWGGSLVRSIGGRGPLEVDVCVTPVDAGDMLLICTDGVTNSLSDDDLSDLLNGSDEVDTLARRLVDRAVYEDGRDNATSVLVRWSRES
jgi:protein phosphatase